MLVNAPFFWGFVALLNYGLTDFFAAKTVRYFSETISVFINYLFGLIILLTLLALNPNLFQATSRVTLLDVLMVVISGLTLYLGVFFLFSGVKKEKVGLVSGLTSSAGMVIMILSVVFLSEALTSLRILGGGLIVVGSVFISINLKILRKEGRAMISIGLVYAALAAIFIGLSGFLSIVAAKDFGWPMTLLIISAIATFQGFLAVFLKRKERKGLKKLSSSGLINCFASALTEEIALAAVILGGLAGSASVTGAVSSGYAFVSVILGWLFLKQRLTKAQILGTAGVVTGLVALSL